MKCENHADRYATTRCYACKIPLCDDCTVPLDDGRLMCDRCSLLTILQKKHQKAREEIQAKKQQRDRQASKGKRMRQIRKWTPVFAALVLLLFGAYYYTNTPIVESRVVDLKEHPDAMMLILDQAVIDYAADHEGFLPNTLNQLMGKYLPRERIKTKDLYRFVYDRTSDDSYRIRPKETDNSIFSNFVVTEKGLEPKHES